jgi:hypothetical protein
MKMSNIEPLVDQNGNPVHAHGGHMLFEGGYYYWFGENRMGRRKVSCYRSNDLTNWEWRNDVLTLDSPVKSIYHRTSLLLETEHADRGYGTGAVIERPKVLFNANTGRYVMWMHWENGRDYSDARCAVADCDTVDGNYVYRGSFNPIGHMSRDCTLFQDDDGTAYFVSAARENADLIMYRLSPDYLSIEEQVKILWPGQAREAPAIMKRNGVYFLISSACTGWLPNQGTYAWSEELTGRWSTLQHLGDATTYDSQPAFIVPITGTESGQTSYLYVGDRWDPSHYHASSYVFLPLSFPSDREMRLDWADQIDIDLKSGNLKAEQGTSSNRIRIKSIGTGQYLAAGDQLEIRKLAYGDQEQQWTVEYDSKGMARLRSGDKVLKAAAEGSLILEAAGNDEFPWRFTPADEEGMLIGCGDIVLTASSEQRSGNGEVTLESKLVHDPRKGANKQLFQLIPVR